MYKGKWEHFVDISGVVNSDHLSNEAKARKIYGALRRLPPFDPKATPRAMEFRTVLSDLRDNAGNDELFEEALSNLYAFCDYTNIWLSAS